MTEQTDPTENTKDWIETKLNALRSEMRLWFVLAFAGPQILARIPLSPAVAFIGSTLTVVGAVAIKLLAVWRV